jgi:hypothetical protein
MSHWTVIKGDKEYVIPYDVEIKGYADKGASVEAFIAAREAKDQEAARLFGEAAPVEREGVGR